MKTRPILFSLVIPLILLSACIATQTTELQPTQTLLPTPVPVTETPDDTSASSIPTYDEVPGPQVVTLGELTMEVYERIKITPTDSYSFITTYGPSSEILKTRRPLRDVMHSPLNPPPLNGQQLRAEQQEIVGKVFVTVNLGDEAVLSVNVGDSTPLNNIHGLWVIREDWYVEVAHTTLSTVPDTPIDARGEIFKNGTSLTEQYGYEETFGFQTINEKPFFFFSKDGEIGINYNGEVSMLGFDHISHYACCSAGIFNPRPYLNMVTFFASKGVRQYYVELGLFSDFNLEMLDLSGAGLTVDAFELQDGSWPDEDHHQSRPAGSLPGWVMKRHETDRKEIIRNPEIPIFQGKALTTRTNIDIITDAKVEVRLDDAVVLSVPAGDLTYSAGMDAVFGVWVHEEHWYMEMAHVEYERHGNITKSTTLGEIYRSGESLSELNSYDETFGFQLLDGKPFFFFKKGDEFGLNYAGEETMLGFDEIAHHYCCGFGIYNPMHYEDMVAFFASRDGVRYYVEAGVFR